MATDSQSTVSTWACLMLSVVLLVTRLALRALRRQRFTHGDYWCLSAAVFILARVIASHFLMLYGSTRVLPPERRLVLLQPGHEAEAEKVVIGSKLILLTRSLLICLLWSLKMAVLDLLAKIMMNMPFERKLLYTLWAILASTFVASLVTVFVECPSFSMYWQLHPDPGACVVGNTWLYTYEISNIVTDALLIIVTSYVILLAKLPVNQRLRILFLFSIGIFLIAISTVRITLGKDSRIQRSHTLWASIEVLFAAVVAVTPTIYALALNRHNSANHPANSYAKSSITGAKRGVEYREYAGDPGYEARVWTELRDSGDRFRGDNASAEGILVETRVEAGEVERGVGIAVCAPLAIYQPESRSSYDKV